MGEIKGYVVRGKANDAPVFYVGDGDFVYAGVGDGETPKTLNTIGDSSYAADSMDNGCTDVRIYAVAEDGAETPLPTYEEALAQLNLILAATEGIGFTGPEDRATERVDLLLASRDSITRRREEALAEIERLRGEAETMRGQRDAFRDHLDLAYKNANAERALWARLVKATETLHIAAMMNAVAAAVDPRSLGSREDTASCRDAVAAARQALRDLGVDVDALLGEP